MTKKFYESSHRLAASGSEYVLQLLFSEKSQILLNSTTTEACKKISTNLKSLQFYKNFDVCLTKFKNIKLKLVTDLLIYSDN